MNKQHQQLFRMMLLAIMSFMPLISMAEYYASEVTLSPGQQTKIYLPEMYVEAMTRYGGGYPYTWSSDNSNICTATTYRSRTYCNIYAKSVGTTKIHYHGEYYRNGVIYDYDCYWDVNVVAAGGEGDNTGVDTPTGDPNEPADKWGVNGKYDIKWYNINLSVFEISTNRELAGLAYLVNNGYSDFTGKTIKITEDISLSGKSWSSIGTYEKQFNGTLDGQGHIIGGLYIGRQNDNQEYFGFFGYLGSKSVVRNITLQGEVNIVNPIYTDTKYSGTHYVGGLAGNCHSTNIENCKCEMTVKYSRNVPNGGDIENVYIGGMFGSCGNGVISYCSHEGDISCVQTPSDAGYSDVASVYVGGLIGKYSGASSGDAILEYSENVSTTISCEVPTNSKAGSWTYVGGLFAKGYGRVEHCRNVCNFDITHHGFAYSSSSISVSVGGISGESTATTIDCYSSVQKSVVTSSRLDNVYYSGIGGNSNKSKANFSNSDVSIQTSRPLSRNYDGSTAFTSAQMRTPAFLEELNMYSILEGHGAVWTQDDGGFPYIAKLYEELDVPVTGITLNKTLLALLAGQEETLTATVKPDNANDKTVTWSSSNTSVVTVSDGQVKAIAAGSATIVCTANDGSGVKATCEVTVTAVVKSIELPKTMTVAAGQTVTLTPMITPPDAVTTLTWTSDDETIAKVNNNGVVTGVKKGQTFINVATDNGKTAYCKLTVTAGDPIAISLPKNVTLQVGKELTLTPVLTPADAETELTWKSDDETVVRVSVDGVLTGVAEGLALVTVSTSNGLTSDACKVKVEPDATGISDVETEKHNYTRVYTLSGQHLVAPRKGINIVGGKKVIIK